MIQTEFFGSECKVIIYTNLRTPESENHRECNLNFELFDGMTERGVMLYLGNLREKIAHYSAEFAIGVKKIYGTRNLGELTNWVHENNPNAAFRVENVSFEPSAERQLWLYQVKERLIGEKEQLKIKHKQQIIDLNGQRDIELKLTIEKIEKRINLEIFKLRLYLKNRCTEILQHVITECFPLNHDVQSNNDSKVECQSDNNEVGSFVTLIDSDPECASKNLQKQFDEVLEDIRKIYKEKIDNLKKYLEKEAEKELCAMRSRIIESLYEDEHDNLNSANNDNTSRSSDRSQIEKTHINDLKSASSSHLERNLSKLTDNSIVALDNKIIERNDELKNRLELEPLSCDVIIKTEPIPTVNIDDDDDEIVFIAEYKQQPNSSKATNANNKKSNQHYQSELRDHILAGSSSLHNNIEMDVKPNQKQPNSSKATNDHLANNKKSNQHDQSELKDRILAGSSSLYNNIEMNVKPNQNVLCEGTEEPSISDIEMTEDQAEELLRKLPIKQADCDSYVYPFPIKEDIFSDEYWTCKQRQNDPKEVQKLVKCVLKYGSMKRKLSSKASKKYKKYRNDNSKCCWEVRCMLRNKRFPTNYHLHAHIKKHHPKGRKIFPCINCGLPFSNNEILNEHRNRQHSKNSNSQKRKSEDSNGIRKMLKVVKSQKSLSPVPPQIKSDSDTKVDLNVCARRGYTEGDIGDISISLNR